MSIEHHRLVRELPEHADRIRELRQTDAHFARQLDEYHALDDRIYRSEIRLETLCDESLEALKKQRAQLKDRLYQQLVQPA